MMVCNFFFIFKSLFPLLLNTSTSSPVPTWYSILFLPSHIKTIGKHYFYLYLSQGSLGKWEDNHVFPGEKEQEAGR